MVVNSISPSTKPFWSWWFLLLFLWFLFNTFLVCCYCFLDLVYPVPHLSSWIRCLINLLITTLKNTYILLVPFAQHPTHLLHDASWFTVLSIFWVMWGCYALTHELVEAFSHQSLSEDPSATVISLSWCLAGFPFLCPSLISPLALYQSMFRFHVAISVQILSTVCVQGITSCSWWALELKIQARETKALPHLSGPMGTIMSASSGSLLPPPVSLVSSPCFFSVLW